MHLIGIAEVARVCVYVCGKWNFRHKLKRKISQNETSYQKVKTKTCFIFQKVVCSSYFCRFSLAFCHYYMIIRKKKKLNSEKKLFLPFLFWNSVNSEKNQIAFMFLSLDFFLGLFSEIGRLTKTIYVFQKSADRRKLKKQHFSYLTYSVSCPIEKLSCFLDVACRHALEKDMATHSSILA